MAALNKILGTDLDATATHTFVIEKTKNLRNFTVEAVLDVAIGYPAAENDAELRIDDGEINPDSGETVDYDNVNKGLVLLNDGDTRAKLRLVDLSTQNVTVVYDPKSANAGTINTLSITFTT